MEGGGLDIGLSVLRCSLDVRYSIACTFYRQGKTKYLPNRYRHADQVNKKKILFNRVRDAAVPCNLIMYVLAHGGYFNCGHSSIFISDKYLSRDCSGF